MHIILVFLMLCAQSGAGSQNKELPKSGCYEKAGSQSEIESCAAKDYKTSDSELNNVYQSVVKKYENHPAVIKRLREAQRAWLSYRDAQIAFLYGTGTGGGSDIEMCRYMRLTRLTEDRIKALKELLHPERGDVCGLYPSE